MRSLQQLFTQIAFEVMPWMSDWILIWNVDYLFMSWTRYWRETVEMTPQYVFQWSGKTTMLQCNIGMYCPLLLEITDESPYLWSLQHVLPTVNCSIHSLIAQHDTGWHTTKLLRFESNIQCTLGILCYIFSKESPKRIPRASSVMSLASS